MELKNTKKKFIHKPKIQLTHFSECCFAVAPTDPDTPLPLRWHATHTCAG